MIVHNKMTRNFFGPHGLKAPSRGWVELSAEMEEIWRKNDVVMGLVDTGCLELVASAAKVDEAAESVNTTPIEPPANLKKDSRVESLGTTKIEVKKGDGQ